MLRSNTCIAYIQGQRRSERSDAANAASQGSDVGPSTDAGPAATSQGGPAATAQGGPTEEDEPIMHLQQRRQHLLDLRMDIMEIRMEKELRRAQCAIDIMSDRMEMMETKKRKGPPSEMEEHGTHGGSCGGSSGSRGGGRGGGACAQDVVCRVCRVQRRHT